MKKRICPLRLAARYDGWRFVEHTTEANFAFAYKLASAALDLFPYLAVAGSEEFGGEEAPDSLKPLVSRVWKPAGTIYHQDLKVRLKPRGEGEHIESYLPGFDEMINSGKTLDEIDEAYARNPELLEGMRPAVDIKDEAVVIQFEEGIRRALEFIVLPDRIELAVYGKPGETRAFSRYLTTYQDKPRVLAETAASLAVLGAKHCLRMNNPSSRDYYVAPSEPSRQLLDGLL